MSIPYAINAIFLVCLACAIVVFCVLFSVWFLLFYGSEEDKGWRVAVVPKIIFVVGFTFTLVGVFLMPYSLFSNKLHMTGTWYLVESICYQVFYSLVLILVVVIVPFSICYYEAEDPYVKNSWIKQSICGGVFTVIILLVFLGGFIGSYFFLGKADIAYVAHTVGQANAKSTLVEAFRDTAVVCTSCFWQKSKMTVLASFVIYMVAMVSLLGYVLFVVFGGCGFTALPISCVCGFLKRAKGIDGTTYNRLRKEFREKSEKLLEIGEKMDRKIDLGNFSSPRDRILYNEFKQTSVELVDDWKKIQTSFARGGDSVVLSVGKLVVGIISGLVSVLWMIHIILYIEIQPWFSFGFLNIVLNYIDYFTSFFPILGTVLYGILAFHLILAVFAGTEEIFGTVPLIAIHPLRKKDTMMSSLLWNVEIFLLIGVSLNQFTAYAFADYASNTVLNLLFGTTIQNLKWFWVFYDYVVKYGFAAFVVIGFVYMTIKSIIPKRKNKNEARLDRLTRGVGRTYYTFNIKKMFGKSDPDEKQLRIPLNAGEESI